MQAAVGHQGRAQAARADDNGVVACVKAQEGAQGLLEGCHLVADAGFAAYVEEG